MTIHKTPIAILISGRGSNMRSLIAACAAPDFPARVALVLSNKDDAAGLDYARECGITADAIPHKAFGKDREAHERAVDARLREAGVEFICLAGYMRLLTPFLTDAWAERMINIHPSLLPLFPGTHTHERVLEAGVRIHGCTVHHVTAGMDEGPIIAQAAVPVFPDADTPDDLAARVLVQEHLLYPAALRKVLEKTENNTNKAASLLVC
ncbi:phosphoribosyl glycinamide formyltransferase [Acetobacter estunensis NRIC 0472]|uniref:Phosphoribosylglycinamide formyltransferase n=1 Tax=Acetobacter estunensis TaxID=104097 RepID=A0A967B540_9PROT|nr:phosphoribosylglycinamide formyltransferase [Acetobacter estunensis]NHO53945.1 phosphoribosylglycinamide formyltransferase [Acetobacter estunensis]GBQ26828.1 phosphoribosyl glycinamide formyltransferase [Acetobacter estunensis NRIC 0472]